MYSVYHTQFDIDKKRFVTTTALVHNELTVVYLGNLMQSWAVSYWEGLRPNVKGDIAYISYPPLT